MATVFSGGDADPCNFLPVGGGEEGYVRVYMPKLLYIRIIFIQHPQCSIKATVKTASSAKLNGSQRGSPHSTPSLAGMALKNLQVDNGSG